MDQLVLDLSCAFALFRTCKIHENNNYGVLNSEFSILMYIVNIDHDVTPNELSTYFNCSKPHITKLLNGLIKKDLIIFEKNQADQRSKIVISTAKGKILVEEKMSSYMAKVNIIVKELGHEKTILLTNLLNDVIKIIKKGED